MKQNRPDGKYWQCKIVLCDAAVSATTKETATANDAGLVMLNMKNTK